MNRIIICLVCYTLLSCNNKGKESFYPIVELNNPILEWEIENYCKMLSLDNDCYKEVAGALLEVREINDSVKRFIISLADDAFIMPKPEPFAFVCKVGDYPVFVSFPSVWHTKNFSEPYFKLSDKSIKDFQKTFFPQSYKSAEETGTISITFSHEKCRFLTFLNDSLIDKRDILGHPYTKIKVRVGDKYIEY